ncbi:hypothetical protein A1Q1_04621 [Trichosporon asahii var. asahii CBS 2479]|uniref:Uncharacterized protein n=1 Tax=Trichosporon asahii var. asahii (strain ATCC 90039 / CBS 2479 / JCM 2466 / KCTC 7840 / NBRC 103889/ NCYC 2677 / UAMH 7654) TaxID=1186058 RepID=J6F5T8_TRIAS|nr:hypothetical protein A1Q1_04621 [Trichosporon asahii var. asahii CBS 2479]EJT52409.1 hypothetical protein A1Q1_04621 [Trichosporon asahii var. asahii CBS 2479]
MLTLPQRPGSTAPTVQHTDQTYESAAVIRIFLNLITCQTEQLPFTSPYTEWQADLESLLYFLDKYDSQPALKQLRLYGAEMALHRSLEDDSAFIFGVTTNDLALCIDVITNLPTWEKSDYAKYPAELRGVNGKSLMDLTCAPFSFAASIPFPYSWALDRACRKTNPLKHPYTFSREFHHRVVAAFQGIEKFGRGAHGIHKPWPAIVQTPNLPKELWDSDIESEGESDG